MGLIQTLDSQLTNMIAAGEVVERPGGIVKELIDNSIDAKSTHITINALQGGLESLEIIDNGCGMDASDATMAFMRHATSKLNNQEDLWSIKTLGFRGEALPSIAAVSKVTLDTSNGEESTRVKLEFGKVIEAKPYPFNKGTKIKIEELFYKTPARLKHLKTPQYEASVIHDIVLKFALGYPHIRFSYYSDGKEIIATRGSGSLKDVFFELYGKELAVNSIEVEAKDYDYRITGLACLPSVNRASRNYMNIYINHRMIRYYKLQVAIQEAFREFMPKDRYPIVTINIEMDEKLVDVNVHPSKWEVRLSKENQLVALVKSMIHQALATKTIAPEVQLKPTMAPINYVSESLDLFMIEKEAITVKENDESSHIKAIDFETTISDIKEEIQPVITAKEENTKKAFPHMNVIGQLDEKYVLASSSLGLYIIDQHAAEERVNYEYFSNLFETTDLTHQALLIPLKLTVSPQISSNLDQVNQALSALDLVFESFGHQDILIRSLPTWMIELNATQFLEDLLDYYASNDRFNINQLTKHKIATMACHHSVRFNHALSLDEMKSLVERLSNAENPFNCPHGRPTFTLINYNELERNFKR